MASDPQTAASPRPATGLLMPLETPVRDLATRLEFLVDYLSMTDNKMSRPALCMLLNDALADATASRDAWDAAWAEARTLRLVPVEAA